MEVRVALTRAVSDSKYPFVPILGPDGAGVDALPAFASQYQGVIDPLENADELAKLIRAYLVLRRTVLKSRQK